MGVVGVRFTRSGPVHYFDDAGLAIALHDCVVAVDEDGLERPARVAIAPDQVAMSQIPWPLKPVVRKADRAEGAQAGLY